MKFASLQVAMALAFLISLPVASACSFDEASIDSRPLAQRLVEAPLGFIGRVNSVAKVRSGYQVSFSVEHRLKGVIPGESISLDLGSSSCHIRFSPGQKWLYAGELLSSASVLLESKPGESIAKVFRVDDSRLEVPLSWQTCKRDQDCRGIEYGCGGMTSAHVDHLEGARKKAWVKGGDPRILSCAFTGQLPDRVPLCESGRCGVWQFERK